MQIAAMRAEAMAEFRAKQKQLAEAKGKGKGGPSCGQAAREPQSAWSQAWRARFIDALPHGNDSALAADGAGLRPLLLELWHEAAEAASGEALAALELFAAEGGAGAAGPLISDDYKGAVSWSVAQSIAPPPTAAPTLGTPQEEVLRIWPDDGKPKPSPAAVLHLDGIGSFGEAEISAAYKRMSRTVHPDKTGDVPGATEAFKCLKDSADELKKSLQVAREILQRLEFIMGFRATEDEQLQKPQAQLFAAALRFLMAVIGVSGEGKCTPIIKQRAAATYEKASGSPGSSASIAKHWFESPSMLALYGSQTMRTAYDCAPKQYRAQFACALSRVAWLEEATGELMRDEWALVFGVFPEIPRWRLLESQLREKTWAGTEDDPTALGKEAGRSRSRSRSRRRKSRSRKSRSQRRKSRSRRRKSRSRSGRRSRSRKSSRSRSRRRRRSPSKKRPKEEPAAAPPKADPAVVAASSARWAFLPAADILLAVGEGMIGATFEGLYVYDRRKKSIHGVWASVTPPPGVVHIDFEVRMLVQECQIDDPTAIEKLLAHCLNRPNTKSDDISNIKRLCKQGGDPNDIVNRQMEELIERTNQMMMAKGKGKGAKGKQGGKAQGHSQGFGRSSGRSDDRGSGWG